MATNSARFIAAQAWDTETTCTKELDIDLANAFAEIIDQLCSKAHLKKATMKELLLEIERRIEADGRLHSLPLMDDIHLYNVKRKTRETEEMLKTMLKIQ